MVFTGVQNFSELNFFISKLNLSSGWSNRVVIIILTVDQFTRYPALNEASKLRGFCNIRLDSFPEFINLYDIENPWELGTVLTPLLEHLGCVFVFVTPYSCVDILPKRNLNK